MLAVLKAFIQRCCFYDSLCTLSVTLSKRRLQLNEELFALCLPYDLRRGDGTSPQHRRRAAALQLLALPLNIYFY